MFSWLRQHPAAEDVDNTTQQQEAEAGKTLAAIFKPSHAAVREAPDTHGDLLRSGVRLFKDDECPSSATTTTTHTSTGDMQEKKKSASSSRKQNGEVGDVLDMFSLPPSPILGYALREEGLVEELVRPPRVLTIQELRSLIVELSSVEQRARYNVDIQLPQQIHNRGRRSLELIVSPCLYMCGLYLLLWKTPRLYFGVTPRSSVVFTRILSLMRWHVPEVERERMARSHRWVFQATNARVTLSFLAGCAVTAIAVVTQPTLDVVDTGPDVELGKESVGFQKHSEAALRWLWLVYYHHPAYRSQAIGKLPQILQSTTARRKKEKMASYVPPEFSEELFSVMLESCTPSRSRVEALTHLALRHLPQAPDTWSALRKALIRQQDLESDGNKALWYLLDSLMKHAPHVFVPLIAPRLQDYVVQQMPWHLVGVVSTLGSGAIWCDAMIYTWEGVLPPHLMRSVKSFVVQLRSGKELTNAMNLNVETDEVQTVDPPATHEQMQQLQETWEVFWSFAAEEKLRGSNATVVGSASSAAPSSVQVKREPTLLAEVKHEGGTQPVNSSNNNNNDDDDDDSDVEYMPAFVRGAQQRALPLLTADGAVMQKARRAARRRPREEE